MNGRVIHRDLDELYVSVLQGLIKNPSFLVPSRDGAVREMVGQHIVLFDPEKPPTIRNNKRKINYPFLVAEVMEFLLGVSDHERMVWYCDGMKRFGRDRGGINVFPWAYGPRIGGIDGQLHRVFSQLRSNPFDRQAVVSILGADDFREDQVPCVISWQFLIRDKRLMMISHVRSQDAFLGLPYDITGFGIVHHLMASALGLRVGEYHHMVGSLHLYDRDVERAKRVIHGRPEPTAWNILPPFKDVGLDDAMQQIHAMEAMEERSRMCNVHSIMEDKLSEPFRTMMKWMSAFNRDKHGNRIESPGL